MFFRTYDAATAGSVSDDLHASNDQTDADDSEHDGCYQLPLPVEQIFWVDSCDSFHSSVDHIAQVNSAHTSGFILMFIFFT